MGFVNKLFVVLRIVQVLCSAAALGSGIYVAWKLRALSQDVDTVVNDAQIFVNGTSSDDITQAHKDEFAEFGTIIEHFFDSGPPIRAYVLASVSLWSLCAIVYLLLAQHSTKHSWLNRRSIVISLELFTATAWVAGLVSVVLLVTEYSAVCVPFEYISKLHFFNRILERVPILHDILPTCTLDFVATAAAATCWALWCITCLIACCTDRHGNCCCGSKRKKRNDCPEIAAYETLTPMQHDSEASKPGFIVNRSSMMSSGKGGFTVNQSPATPAPQYHSPASQSYTPVPQYASPQSNFTISPTDRWGR